MVPRYVTFRLRRGVERAAIRAGLAEVAIRLGVAEQGCVRTEPSFPANRLDAEKAAGEPRKMGRPDLEERSRLEAGATKKELPLRAIRLLRSSRESKERSFARGLAQDDSVTLGTLVTEDQDWLIGIR